MIDDEIKREKSLAIFMSRNFSYKNIHIILYIVESHCLG